MTIVREEIARMENDFDENLEVSFVLLNSDHSSGGVYQKWAKIISHN